MTKLVAVHDPENDLFSDAMDRAMGSFHGYEHGVRFNAARAREELDGEKVVRRGLAIAIKAYFDELPSAEPTDRTDWKAEYLQLAPFYTRDGMKELMARYWPDTQLVERERPRYYCLEAGCPGEHRSKRDICTQSPEVNDCTCHPDDNPPRPCPRKYALSECRKAAAVGPFCAVCDHIEAVHEQFGLSRTHAFTPKLTAPPQKGEVSYHVHDYDEEAGGYPVHGSNDVPYVAVFGCRSDALAYAAWRNSAPSTPARKKHRPVSERCYPDCVEDCVCDRYPEIPAPATPRGEDASG